MSRRRYVPLLPLVLTTCLALAKGQAPSQEPSVAQSAPSIKSTTRLVQVNVVVRDKKGDPVAGLRKEDFKLLDQDQPQAIAIFTQEGSSASAPAPKPLPPGVFTNRLDATGQLPGNVTVVLLDALNTRIEDQAYARQQMEKFIAQLQPQDHVAIYVLTTRIEILHDFTQDLGALIAALRRYRGDVSPQLSANDPISGDFGKAPDVSSATGPGNAVPATENPFLIMEGMLNTGLQRLQDAKIIDRAETTTAAIEAIANHLARIPGRKNLVWVSGSFPLSIGATGPTMQNPTRETITFSRRLERAARAVSQANLAIYPVDARGLMVSANYNAVSPDGYNPQSQRPLTPEVNTDDFVTMDTLAERTGGRSFHNANDLGALVRKALADSELTYSMAFYPSHGKWDGRFHEIKIQVNRPGAQVRYRKGYYASPDPPNDPTERKAALDAAVASPIESGNLSLIVQVIQAQKDAPNVISLGVALDVREIFFTDTSTGRTCDLDFLFVQRDVSSQQLAGEQKHAEFNMTQQKYKSLLQTGMLVTDHVTLNPATTRLRIAVRDAKSGAIGSLDIPLAQNPRSQPK